MIEINRDHSRFLESPPPDLTLTIYGEGFEASFQPSPTGKPYSGSTEFRVVAGRDVYVTSAIASSKNFSVAIDIGNGFTLQAGQEVPIILNEAGS